VTVTLLQGDCLEILPTLPDKSVDAIITDLPYGTTACKWDVVIPFAPMWEQVKRLCKGAFVTTASQPFTSVLIMSNLKWFKYELVWDKNYGCSPGTAKYRPMPSHESVLVFGNGSTVYNPQMRAGKPYTDIRKDGGKTREEKGIQNEHRLGYKTHEPIINNGTRFPLSVIRVQKFNQPDQHPTQKPVALYEYLIKTYTNAGDTVLDFCMGSGTTGVAAVKLGRNFIGIEKEPKYFEIAARRIKEAQQQMIMELA
jgi:site-specific DNA-methyltransferase (adenine-specific)